MISDQSSLEELERKLSPPMLSISISNGKLLYDLAPCIFSVKAVLSVLQ